MTKQIWDWAERAMWIPRAVLVLSLMVIGYYAADREHPFRVVSVERSVAHPGEWVTLRASVWRDTSRRCSADYSRFLFSSDGSRYDLGDASASSDMIEALERNYHGLLGVSVRVPESMSVGHAELVTVLRYRCNKVHALWPIEVTTRMPFTVQR